MSEKLTPITVILSRPRGFCAGVVRAVDVVERALKAYGPPIYVRHEIVHNKAVVERLRGMGAVFVEEVSEIPRGALTVFSAHGVSNAVEKEAAERALDVIDATCPLVRKVHKEGNRYISRGFDVVLIGHRGHPEIQGTLGQIKGNVHLISDVEDVKKLPLSSKNKIAYITQTTLSVLDTKDIISALRQRFSNISGPDTRDICFATQNRQASVIKISKLADALIVIGSQNSSNSNRLREIGTRAGIPSYLIDGPRGVEMSWLRDIKSLGLTAGASAPEYLVQDTIQHIKKFRQVSLETLDGIEEKVEFSIPKRLRDSELAMA